MEWILTMKPGERVRRNCYNVINIFAPKMAILPQIIDNNSEKLRYWFSRKAPIFCRTFSTLKKFYRNSAENKNIYVGGTCLKI
jgi:hypothetical protein